MLSAAEDFESKRALHRRSEWDCNTINERNVSLSLKTTKHVIVIFSSWHHDQMTHRDHSQPRPRHVHISYGSWQLETIWYPIESEVSLNRPTKPTKPTGTGLWKKIGMHTVPYYGDVHSVRRLFDGNGTPVHRPSNFIRGLTHGDGAGLKTDV